MYDTALIRSASVWSWANAKWLRHHAKTKNRNRFERDDFEFLPCDHKVLISRMVRIWWIEAGNPIASHLKTLPARSQKRQISNRTHLQDSRHRGTAAPSANHGVHCVFRPHQPIHVLKLQTAANDDQNASTSGPPIHPASAYRNRNADVGCIWKGRFHGMSEPIPRRAAFPAQNRIGPWT